jgi:glycosyltransferase involved in cell wall biosynthesis
VINYIKSNGKFPSYTEALHLFDLSNQTTYSSVRWINGDISKERVVYIDITQFVKQGFKTGIQRVVSSFTQYAPNCKFIFFTSGYYHEFIEFDLHRLQKRSNFISRVEKVYKFFYRLTFSKNLKKSSRGLRDLLFSSLYLGVKKIDIDDLLSSNLFIPDLPSERTHLEAILCLGSFTNVNLSVFVHDLIPITHPELMPENSTNEFNLYAKILLTADKIFCASNYVKTTYLGYRQMHGEFKGKQRIYVRPFPQFLQNERNKFQVVSKKFLKSLGNTQYILAVGTIFPRKNLSLLVRALKILENNNVQCNLVVLAHSNWSDRGFDLACQSLSSNKVLIYYHSNDAELIYAYQNSLALGFPSLAEGFGLPVIESLSYDKITIVNNIEPMKSLSSSKNLRRVDNRAVAWAREITRIIEIKMKPIRSEPKKGKNTGTKNLLKLEEQKWVQDLFTLILN